MKKLMFMLAAVAMAAAANAAFVDWQFGKDTSLNGWTVYAFDAANQATVLGALAAYDASAQSTIDGLVLSSAEVKKGVAKGAGTDVGSATSLLLLAVNGALADGVAYKYDTYDISSSTYTPPDPTPGSVGPTALSQSGTIAAAGGGGGGGGGTPEPTSGLLLLVGAGILGLRRKRA